MYKLWTTQQTLPLTGPVIWGNFTPNKTPRGRESKQPSCCHPPTSTVLTRVGSLEAQREEEGGVQECAGSPLLKRSSLLGSNLPRTLTNKHTRARTHTHTDRLYGGG